MMTLDPHPDPVVPADRVRFFRTQGRAEPAGTGPEAEWAEAWGSWEARGGQAVVSLEGDRHSDRHPMPDLTTSWGLEECLASEVGVGLLGEEEVDSPQAAPLSLTCHRTSVLRCTPDLVSIPCCPQGVWEVQGEEGGHPTHALEYLHSSSMAKEDTHLTAPRYLAVEVPEGPHTVRYLPWEEAWVPG